MLVVDHKLYLFHHRTHHFLTGLVIAVIGIGLMFHDRRDWRVAFRDFVAQQTTEPRIIQSN